jgi:hypothetical protein
LADWEMMTKYHYIRRTRAWTPVSSLFQEYLAVTWNNYEKDVSWGVKFSQSAKRKFFIYGYMKARRAYEQR